MGKSFGSDPDDGVVCPRIEQFVTIVNCPMFRNTRVNLSRKSKIVNEHARFPVEYEIRGDES